MSFRRKIWIWQPFCESVSDFFQQGIFAHYDVSLLNRRIDSRKVWFSCSFSSILLVLKFSKLIENFETFVLSGAAGAPPPGGVAKTLGAPAEANFSKFSNRFETFTTDEFDKNEQKNRIFSRIDALIQYSETS